MRRGQKRELAERRERNRQLAIEDAKHRCGSCRRTLPKFGAKVRFSDGTKYCSDDCLADAEERG